MPGLDFPVICPQLIGRDEEIAALEAALAGEHASYRSAILVSGEAGIGKSRLVQELRSRLEAGRWQVVEMACYEQSAQVPFSGLKDTLARLARREDLDADTLDPGYDAVLRELLSSLGQPEAGAAPEQRERVSAAFLDLVDGLSRSDRCLLVVEDLHWCDENTLYALLALARLASERALHLLITLRSEEAPPAVQGFLADLDRERLSSELRLASLSLSETDEMLKAIFGSARSTAIDLLQRLYRLTEGNPFFVEEVLRSIAGHQTNPQLDALRLEAAQVPRTVLDAVGQRIERVSASARSLLEIASVVGLRFSAAHLQALADSDEAEVLAGLRELIQCQLVIEDEDGFAFRHALTREAVAARLLRREKVLLHQRIAAYLESEDGASKHPEELSYHYYEAGDWARVSEFAELAGARAMAMFAPAIALEHYTRALDAAARAGTEASCAAYRGRAASFEVLGDFERARDDLERAIDIAEGTGSLPALVDCLLDLGLLWSARDYARTLPYYRRALEAAERLEDRSVIARCLGRLANGLTNTGDFDQALRHLKDALEIQRELGDQHAVAGTLDLIGMAGLMGGQFRDSLAAYREALALMDLRADRRGRVSVLASIPVLSGTYQTAMLAPALSLRDATPFAEEAVTLARELGVPSDLSYALWQSAFLTGPQARASHARAMAHESLRLAVETDHKQWQVGAHTALGAIHVDLLRPGEALGELRQSLALAHELGAPLWEAQVSSLLVDALLLDGRQDEAATLLQTPAIEPPRSMNDVWWMTARAEVAFARGDYAEARAVIDAIAATRAPGLRLQRLLALIALREGDLTRSCEILAALPDMAREQGHRALEWRLCCDLAHTLLASGRRDEARTMAARAIDVIDLVAAGAGGDDGFRRKSMLALPAALRERPRASASVLTARELEIAGLIADGLTNREIAERFVLSSRTVETHVANAMAKLGFASRAQLAAWFAEHHASS